VCKCCNVFNKGLTCGSSELWPYKGFTDAAEWRKNCEHFTPSMMFTNHETRFIGHSKRLEVVSPIKSVPTKFQYF